MNTVNIAAKLKNKSLPLVEEMKTWCANNNLAYKLHFHYVRDNLELYQQQNKMLVGFSFDSNTDAVAFKLMFGAGE
ncbi:MULTISPECIES: hypothetical protein [Burkholderia cepacia complex]|uniref:Uncharacterized protein n=1 Tax=Burkholderia vietnamiensis TaxID=60552 RepID=A0AAW7T7Q3_BURVI|nr:MULTISPECIES: hypothetical protein [Burkholderia cepacia complex]MBU9639569.1 hypothetical protein [Burkholderia multivorans]MDN7798325.1 hypothetical protein [Burkholderia vietnamiensis]